MYNFNQTSLSTPPMLGVGMDFCSGTPRTPEILNSLIAMTNPFEYSYASTLASQQSHVIPMSMSMSPILADSSPVIECKMENSYLQFDNNSQSNCSSLSSLESPSTTPYHMSSSMLSTTTTTTSSTPSLQQTRSQLIKAGVKLLIQSKRKNSGSSSCDADCKPPPLKIRATSVSSPTSFSSSSQRNNFIPIANNEVPSSASSLTSPKQLTSPISSLSFPLKSDDNSSCDEDYDTKPLKAGRQFLTPEDEDRRKRRRERNKIAATKCRLKKRECINNLMRESEVLEAQNVDLKTQMKSLEEEFKYLKEMWQAHQNECKNMSLLGNNGSRENHHHQHHSQQQQQHHQNNLCHNNNNNNNHNGNLSLVMPELETLKDTNNNKHLNNLDLQLPSLTPLINCNVSFDFY